MSVGVAIVVAALAIVAIVAVAMSMSVVRTRREQFIPSYAYPPGLFDRLSKRHPDLAFKDVALVSRALRQFFLAHLKSGRQFVSMPSQVVDDLWHEFILYTKNYESFCRQAFGHFLHHTPAAALGAGRSDNAGLRRVWWWCCREENIDPRRPSRLPLLFALDAKLAIPGGFTYAADCSALRDRAATHDGATVHCGGDFSDSSFAGGSEGFGGDGGHGHGGGGHDGSSGDSGGDGGSGCGGGGSGCGGGGGGGD